MPSGAHGLEYEVVQDWAKLPEGYAFTEAVGVAVDSRERVYVFCRAEHPLLVFDMEGRFLKSMGEGLFKRPHGIYIDNEDKLYLADDEGHAVQVLDPEGKRLMTLGSGNPAETGFAIDASPVQHSAGPFNRVTNVARHPDGSLYVADGYGNARVHKFTGDGRHEFSWGEPGGGPGQFNLPHGIAVGRDGTVYVCDRENARIQLFSDTGEYKGEWGFPDRPADIFIDPQENIYIAELGFRHFKPVPVHFPWRTDVPEGHTPYARVTVCDPAGQVQYRIGREQNEVLPGNFIAPHGIWVDRRGDLYVGEVVRAAGAVDKLKPITPPTFQKFRRAA